MLKINIDADEYYDRNTGEFIDIEPVTLCLEHSLLAISKWEAKYCKAFLSSEKSNTEIMDYIRMMTFAPEDVDPNVYIYMPEDKIGEIQRYIESPMTATTFSDAKKRQESREFITSELVYYWMTANSIPFSCETWPLPRLLTLIHICGIKNNPDNYKKGNKKLTSSAIARRKALNDARRAQHGTSG